MNNNPRVDTLQPKKFYYQLLLHSGAQVPEKVTLFVAIIDYILGMSCLFQLIQIQSAVGTCQLARTGASLFKLFLLPIPHICHRRHELCPW